MFNSLKWVCVCAVLVALANSSRPAVAQRYWYWHEYADYTGSEAQGREVGRIRHCSCMSCETYDNQLKAYAEVTEAGSEHVGSWNAGSSGNMGSENPCGDLGYDDLVWWNADMWAEADCSGNASVGAYADAIVEVMSNGPTIYWEYCGVTVQNNHGVGFSQIVFDISTTPDADYVAIGVESSEWYVIDGSMLVSDPASIELHGYTTAFCDIDDQNATGSAYADMIDCGVGVHM